MPNLFVSEIQRNDFIRFYQLLSPEQKLIVQDLFLQIPLEHLAINFSWSLEETAKEINALHQQWFNFSLTDSSHAFFVKPNCLEEEN